MLSLQDQPLLAQGGQGGSAGAIRGLRNTDRQDCCQKQHCSSARHGRNLRKLIELERQHQHVLAATVRGIKKRLCSHALYDQLCQQ